MQVYVPPLRRSQLFVSQAEANSHHHERYRDERKSNPRSRQELIKHLNSDDLGEARNRRWKVREEIEMRSSIVVFLVGCIAALPGRAALENGENQATSKDGAKLSTITGCVARSGDLYRLDQAIIGTDRNVERRPGRPPREPKDIVIRSSSALT